MTHFAIVLGCVGFQEMTFHPKLMLHNNVATDCLTFSSISYSKFVAVFLKRWNT